MSALTLTRPTEPAVAEAIAAAGASGFSYDAVGCTREGSPGPGWVSDHERRVIGRGRSTYLAAVAALERWEQFDLDWVWPVRTDVPIEIDADFAFLSRSLGLWSLNICRVVYVERSADIDHERFGFAYGTLAMHSVRGEERFLAPPTSCTSTSARSLGPPSSSCGSSAPSPGGSSRASPAMPWTG